MNTLVLEFGEPSATTRPGTTCVPVQLVPPRSFAQEALARLPLAESVLLLGQQVTDAAFLQNRFDQQRGRCCQRAWSFPSLVPLLADALLPCDGSARARFERASDNATWEVSLPAAYGQWRRVPMALRTAFLTEGTARLRELLPVQPAVTLPSRRCDCNVTLRDGKAIQRLAKRLQLLRGLLGGLLGGKALVARERHSGLAVALQADPDGEIKEIRLVPGVRAAVRQRWPGPRLWVGERQSCDWDQTGRFRADGEHLLVRYPPKVPFHPAPARCPRGGSDAAGRR